ncbi:MAG: hypothetical protein IKJ78_05480 [Bacteroidales bacterium]|nr:hypothetical protein [Bacteroidales bacterium]
MIRAAVIIALAVIAGQAAAEDNSLGAASADKPPSSTIQTGLGVFAGANAYWASDATANFYSGAPTATDNVGGIYRIMKSNTYGREIWQDLRTNRLITDAVSDQTMLTVAEYPQMHYRISYQIGLGIRYDYESGFGWLLRFDLARLNAQGQWLLSTDNNTGQLGTDRYLRCGITGQEDRINIDLAVTRTVSLTEAIVLELNIGASLVNTKVRDNIIEVNGHTYSILDRWGGRIPDDGVAPYEYINQGGVGYGFFATAAVGYRLPAVGAIKAAYTCAQLRTVLQNYTAWGWQHTLGIRIEMNNFSFLQ